MRIEAREAGMATTGIMPMAITARRAAWSNTLRSMPVAVAAVMQLQR
jgi:hypothetical protein